MLRLFTTEQNFSAMERRNRKKWIIAAVAAVILTLGSFIAYEVISFNRDMEELGRGLSEMATGLNEMAEGLSKLNFSADTSSTPVDSTTAASERVDSVRLHD